MFCKMKIGFVSLGCSKNLVDTEMMIGIWKENGFQIVQHAEDADIILVNTCGFIETAKQEAINTILEMADYKKNNCKYLIVTGCLVKRYKKELEKEIPEVDLWISIDEYPKFWNMIEKMLKHKRYIQYDLDYHNRVITTGRKTAYLKIAEGCSNFCTYCAIPSIRGPYISREKEDIISEAKELAEKGIEEIIIIAQDTTKYGIDLYGEAKLVELLKSISKIEKVKWVRFLYAYPESITDELIEEVKNNPKVCKYFDIPIQHISDRILKKMNRKSNSTSIKELIIKIRSKIPNVIIRTSLIVGFPSETDEDFNKLYEFVKVAKFDKLGVFQYSKEDGTAAGRMTEQVHFQTKKKRWNKIMKLQQGISEDNMKLKVGNTYEVLLENKTADGKYFVGRSYMDVPDMDGYIYVKINPKFKIGDFVNCKIASLSSEYDLIGIIR